MTAPSASWRRALFAAVLVLGAGAAAVSLLHSLVGQTRADDDDDAESVANPPTRVVIKNGIAILTLSAADLQNAGIESARLARAPEIDSVVGFATVLDPTPLADLSSRYRDAEAQVESATAKLAVSSAAFDRAQILYRDQQNISTAQLQNAQSAFELDQVALAAARAHLGGVAASIRQAWGSALGTALIDNAPLLNELLARNIYLVKVTLPPSVDTPSPPETADARLNDRTIVRLNYISLAATTNPKLQGISYFYTAPAQEGLLPGLNLETTLGVRLAQRGWIVPNSAVVWLEGQAWIYIRTDPKTFIRQRISPDRPAADDGYIVTGLPPNADVAVHGAQMLLSEEFRAQVPVED